MSGAPGHAEIDRLGLRRGPIVPSGVMARRIDDRRVLYLNLNLDAEPKSKDPTNPRFLYWPYPPKGLITAIFHRILIDPIIKI